MVKSVHNIFSRLEDSEEYFIVNLLSRNADILSTELASEYVTGKFSNEAEWADKGYLTEPEKEKQDYRNAYFNFIQNRDRDEVQLFFVPTYSCNFGCSYCYQDGYEQPALFADKNIVSSFFNYIKKHFADRKKYITVFGGEPLLSGERSKRVITEIINKANEDNIGLAFVTNGYNLEEYIPLLKTANIREVQVTLDGLKEIHDRRRPLKNGSSTFDKIVSGIDASLDKEIPVNLRTVIDKDNIHELPALAEFAVKKGWTQNRSFKTQLGRNYELHYCQKEQNRLYDRIGMYKELYKLIKTHPVILEYHRPAFSISRFLFENGELPQPLFDSCPGCKTEWAFDYTGNIYSCTATVGKPGESLGTFHPEETGKTEIIKQWEERDVTEIPECINCSLQLACGGGCASVAKNNSGKLLSPDCRPVKELISLGISLYSKT